MTVKKKTAVKKAKGSVAKAKKTSSAKKTAKKTTKKKEKPVGPYYSLEEASSDVPKGAVVTVLEKGEKQTRIAVASPLDFRGTVLTVDNELVSQKELPEKDAKHIRGLYTKLRTTAMAQVHPLQVKVGTVFPVPRPGGLNVYYEVIGITETQELQGDDTCHIKYRRDLHPLLVDPPAETGAEANVPLKSVYTLLVNADSAVRSEQIGGSVTPVVLEGQEVVEMDDAVKDFFSVEPS